MALSARKAAVRLRDEIQRVLERIDQKPADAPFGQEALTDGHTTLRSLFESVLNPRGYGIEDVTGMSVRMRGVRMLTFLNDETYEVAPSSLPVLLDMEAEEVDPVQSYWGADGVDFSAILWLDDCVLTIDPAPGRNGSLRTVASFLPVVPPMDRAFSEGQAKPSI